GTHASVSLERQISREVAPVRIEAVDQRKFPCAAPALETAFSGASFRDGCVLLEIYEQNYAIFAREPRDQLALVFEHTTTEVVCHANIKHPAAAYSRECRRSIACSSAVSFPAPRVPDAAQHEQRVALHCIRDTQPNARTRPYTHTHRSRFPDHA